MKYQLISEPLPIFSSLEQVLLNRGIQDKEINHYLNTTDKDINSYKLLNETKLAAAAKALILTIQQNKTCVIVVDSDCDGFTSSAVLINYLYKSFTSWTKNNIQWYLHQGKEHGLNDMPLMNWIEQGIGLVICPDAASNDFTEHQKLKSFNIPLICLDHHEAEYDSPDAIVINSQFDNYPNKELSGAGVTWQFCRYLDSLLGLNYADSLLDLVALGLTADMMSLKSFETKRLIEKGFLEENIKNPFIREIKEVNAFSIGGTLTPTGAAFYIAPFVNAMVRSGTAEEKELLFKSMLEMEAFQTVPSTKRGHKEGVTEILYEQAVRVAKNVKNRQAKLEAAGLELLDSIINDTNLLEEHRAIIFTLNKGQIDKNVAGLCANKEMAKYLRPCCILTKGEVPYEQLPENLKRAEGEGLICYQGSARGCDKRAINNFKDICAGFDKVVYATGHQGAFGLAIPETEINAFLEYLDNKLKDMPTENIYSVDFEYKDGQIDSTDILELASCPELWGKDMDEPLVAIENVKITPDNITLMKRNTMKITLPCGVSCLKFFADTEEFDALVDNASTWLTIIGTCNKNEWNGKTYPQILIKDYEIIRSSKFDF